MIDAITVPYGEYKRLCDVVFGAIRAQSRAYVFISRKIPAEFLVVGSRNCCTFNDIAMNSKKYLFVAMYEQNVRQQDVLDDAQEAYELVYDGFYPAREKTEAPAGLSVFTKIVLACVGAVLLVAAAFQLLRSETITWIFGS